MKRTLSLIVLLALLLSACGGAVTTPAPTATKPPEPTAPPKPTEPPPPTPTPEPSGPPDLTGETIKFYHFGDLSGPLAAITAPLLFGAEDGVKAINEAGGIFGAQLEIEFRDTGGNVDEAVAAYDAFTSADDNVLFILTYGSGDSEALAARVVEDKIPNVAAGLSGKAIYGEGSGWTFGIGPIYADQFGYFLTWLKDNWTDAVKPAGAGDDIKVAHISWPTAFGQAALTDELRAYADSLGIEIVFEEKYDLAPTADTTAALLSAQAAGANVIWTNTLAFGPAVILNDLKSLDIRDQFVVAGPYVVADLATYAFLADPANAVGLYGVTPFRWWNEVDHPGIQYLNALMKTYGRDARVQGVGYLGAVAAIDVIKQALETAILEVGFENLTGEAVYNALQSMGEYEALDGVLTVDYSGDSRSVHLAQIIQVQGGPDKFVTVQDFSTVPDLRPK